MKEVLTTAWRLLREATGEAKWDAYITACTDDGVRPMSRREFERHRSEIKEHSPSARCC